jgi:hypothetical protein
MYQNDNVVLLFLACPPQISPIIPQQSIYPPGFPGGFGGVPLYAGIGSFVNIFRKRQCVYL